MFFGTGADVDPGMLRPLAAWTRGEDGAIRVYRRGDPPPGARIFPPGAMGPGPKSTELPGGGRWYEWKSDATQFYFLTLGTIVIEAKDRPLARAASLRADMRAWAEKTARSLVVAPEGR